MVSLMDFCAMNGVPHENPIMHSGISIHWCLEILWRNGSICIPKINMCFELEFFQNWITTIVFLWADVPFQTMSVDKTMPTTSQNEHIMYKLFGMPQCECSFIIGRRSASSCWLKPASKKYIINEDVKWSVCYHIIAILTP